jgi:hypothetical protein
MDEMGTSFPLFPFVFPHCAPVPGRKKEYLPLGTKEIPFVLTGYY